MGTVAQAMINDAYQYKNSSTPPDTNTAILVNADMYRVAATTAAEVRSTIYVSYFSK